MTLNRRELLQGAGATLATVMVPSWLSGCDDPSGPAGCSPSDHPVPDDLPSYAHDGPLGPETMFSHGVVSGDPATDRVILWTCVSPGTDAPVEVWWEVALDPAFSRRVLQGTFTTDATRDFTVKVDAVGLQPAVTYYYRFFAAGRESPIGRTRTAPSGAIDRLRFAVMSCSSYSHGYFHAYSMVAARSDLDAVIHLGDYIYEYGNGEYGDLRTYDPPYECLTLADYRRRYRHYRLDGQLQAAHRQHPFICVWDDHEVADNSYATGAANHDPDEGSFADRLSAARRAYAEYMPIRDEVPGSIYRKLAYGDLVDLVMLDTRNEARSLQLAPNGVDDPSRTLLGAAQEHWFESTVASSSARWLVLGQQVMLAQFTLDAINHAPSNLDQWDGYSFARDRLLDVIEEHALGRTVVLTGDIHSSWAADVSRDPWDASEYDPATGSGTLAVEFVTPAITSPGFAETATGEDFFGSLALEACPHIKFGNFVKRGYLVLDLQHDKVQADYFHLSTVTETLGATEAAAASVAAMHGEPRLVVMDGPESAPNACAPAP
jgi:alkaline phosphatase D